MAGADAVGSEIHVDTTFQDVVPGTDCFRSISIWTPMPRMLAAQLYMSDLEEACTASADSDVENDAQAGGGDEAAAAAL